MALYESTIIIRQDISVQEVYSVSDWMKNLIAERNGKVLKDEHWGLRELAYPIKKYKKGYYIHICAEMDALELPEFNRKIKLNENILRHLDLKVDSISDKPSPIISDDNDEELPILPTKDTEEVQ